MACTEQNAPSDLQRLILDVDGRVALRSTTAGPGNGWAVRQAGLPRNGEKLARPKQK